MSTATTDEACIDLSEHLGLAYWVAMNYTDDPIVEDSEEYGEAMLAMAKAAQQYDPSKGTFATYARAAMNHAIWLMKKSGQRMKRRKPSAHFTECLHLIESTPDADAANGIMIGEILDAANRVLTPTQAKVVRMFLTGATQAEIAAEVGISRQAVGQAYSRAVGKIRDELGVDAIE